MVRKILRRLSIRGLSNVLAGRPHFREEKEVDFERTLKLLESLSGKTCVRGWITYRHADRKKWLDQKTTPYRSCELISKQLDTSTLVYIDYHFEGGHEVYFGDTNEMHYIRLFVREKIENKKGPKPIIRIKRANIEFLIENP